MKKGIDFGFVQVPLRILRPCHGEKFEALPGIARVEVEPETIIHGNDGWGILNFLFSSLPMDSIPAARHSETQAGSTENQIFR